MNKTKETYYLQIADLLGIKFDPIADDETDFLMKARNQIIFHLLTGSSISSELFVLAFDWSGEYLNEHGDPVHNSNEKSQ